MTRSHSEIFFRKERTTYLMQTVDKKTVYTKNLITGNIKIILDLSFQRLQRNPVVTGYHFPNKTRAHTNLKTKTTKKKKKKKKNNKKVKKKKKKGCNAMSIADLPLCCFQNYLLFLSQNAVVINTIKIPATIK